MVTFQHKKNENAIINHTWSLHNWGEFLFYSWDKMNMHTTPIHRVRTWTTAALVSSCGAHGCNTEYKTKAEFPTSVKTQKKPYRTKSHSHSLQWSEESAAFWTLQPANSSFYCHRLSCHSSRRKSWNVSLWKSQENIMDWEKAKLCRTK